MKTGFQVEAQRDLRTTGTQDYDTAVAAARGQAKRVLEAMNELRFSVQKFNRALRIYSAKAPEI